MKCFRETIVAMEKRKLLYIASLCL